MPDPYLFDIMHGTNLAQKKSKPESEPIKKNRFEVDLEDKISQRVDVLMKEEDPYTNKLLSPDIRREKIKNEIYEELDLSEFSDTIGTAIAILEEQGLQYLNEEEHSIVLEDIENIRNKLDSLDLNITDQEIIKSIFKVSPTSLSLITRIAIAKFSEDQLPNSLSIFSLLTLLDSDNPDYWYRVGIVAQKCERYDLALRTFDVVKQLIPEFMGSRIFMTQCYLQVNLNHKAVEEMAEIKKLLKTTNIEQEWEERIADLENLFSFK